MWDASPVVASIVKNRLSDADANALLERDASRVLATMAPNFGGETRSVTVRVIYSKTGDVSPVYGTPTFAGIERYATLTRPLAGAWREDGTPALVHLQSDRVAPSSFLAPRNVERFWGEVSSASRNRFRRLNS